MGFCPSVLCFSACKRKGGLRGCRNTPSLFQGALWVRLGCASSCSPSQVPCGPWHAGGLEASGGTGRTSGDKLLQGNSCLAPSAWPGLLSPVKLTVGLMGFCPSENRIEDSERSKHEKYSFSAGEEKNEVGSTEIEMN